MDPDMQQETVVQGYSRRQALQRAGLVAGAAGVVWAAPAVTTLGARAFAAGSPAPGTAVFATTNIGTRTYTNVVYGCSGSQVTFSASGANAADSNQTSTVTGTFGTTVGAAVNYTFTRGAYVQHGSGQVQSVVASTYTVTLDQNTGNPSTGTFTNVPACP